MSERDQYFAALQARLGRVAASGDASPVLEPAALAEAQHLAEISRGDDDDGDLEPLKLLGWLHWTRYLALPEGQNSQDLAASIGLLTPCFINGTGNLPEPLMPELARKAVSTAAGMLEQISGSTDLTLITATANLWQRIIDSIPADDPSRPVYLSNLAGALWSRAERTGILTDLDSAIEILGSALSATPEDHSHRAAYLSNIGTALQVRYQLTGAQADIDGAIKATRAAVGAAADNDSNRAGYLSNLANALRIRFADTGAQADLDDAIATAREAVTATPDKEPKRPEPLANLGAVLLTRFERSGARADLDNAIEITRAAIAATPEGHPGRAANLANLATALQDGFEVTGALADLDASIATYRASAAALPDGHPGRHGKLSNLGSALLARFRRAENTDDLNEAIEVTRAAITAIDEDHPNRARYQSNLGNALRFRFNITRAWPDLATAIEAIRAAVKATSDDHPNRLVMLSNLGNALYDLFGSTGKQTDLDDAINAYEAAAAIPDDHPGRAVIMANLGNALSRRFEHTGTPADRDTAFSRFAQAADLVTAPPTMRIQAAREAAALCSLSDPGTAADLLETAVGLMSQVAPRQLRRSDQQFAIARFAGLAGDAAAQVLAVPSAAPGKAARALRMLEAARAVLLSQTLATRDDLTELRQLHSGLAARFEEIRDWLDQDSDALGALSDSTVSALHATEGRRRLADDLAALLTEIRALEGFTRFGLAPADDELVTEARSGPIVTFNISEYRSDALLLTRDGITALELPSLAHGHLLAHIDSFSQALDTITDPWVNSGARRDAQATLSHVLEWLWDCAAEPVLSALGYDHPPARDTEWPRVWWIPGGLLGLLPLHAAGHHTKQPGDHNRRTVIDRVISSYTPTIRALRYARQQATRRTSSSQTLIVAMPATPGVQSPLHHVPAEVSMLRSRLPNPILLTEPAAIDGNSLPVPAGVPTKETVLARLPGCRIAHFACHGASDPADPSKSMLLLHDHATDPFTVASLAPVKLDLAELAYLSACRTAFTGTGELLDEAIHLSSAFQLAGFPHVIGTLWEIDDAHTVTIAEDFYAGLRSAQGTIDTSQATRALHHAIRAARDNMRATPSLWAAYLHAGA